MFRLFFTTGHKCYNVVHEPVVDTVCYEDLSLPQPRHLVLRNEVSCIAVGTLLRATENNVI